MSMLSRIKSKIPAVLIDRIRNPRGGVWRHYNRFVILARPRSGTWFLRDLLNGHPDVICDGELFCGLNGDPRTVLRNLWGARPVGVGAVGFKLLYNHPGTSVDEAAREALSSVKHLRIIHLIRRDDQAAYLSYKRALETGVYQRVQGEPVAARECSPVDLADILEPSRWAGRMADRRDWWLRGIEGLTPKPMLTVYYEDLVADRASELNRIWQFLGVSCPPRVPETRLDAAFEWHANSKTQPKLQRDIVVAAHVFMSKADV